MQGFQWVRGEHDRHDGVKRHAGRALAAASALGMFACSGIDEGDETATVQAAIGETPCATVAPDHSSDINVNVTTPSTYGSGKCTRAYVIDVEAPGGADGEVGYDVNWEGPVPGIVKACTSSKVRADLYKAAANGTFVLQSTQESRGQWIDATVDSCQLPYVAVFVPWQSLEGYRLVVQAFDSRLIATRAVSVTTGYLNMWRVD